MNEVLDPKPNKDEVAEGGKSLGYCHLCNKVGMFAVRCCCSGYCIKPILKQDSTVGSTCKCSISDKVGIFGGKCLCGHMFRI